MNNDVIYAWNNDVINERYFGPSRNIDFYFMMHKIQMDILMINQMIMSLSFKMHNGKKVILVNFFNM